MAGQHIDREAAYGRCGMTVAQRDAYVRQLRKRGFKLREIAKVTGLSVSYVGEILTPRGPRVRTKFCEGCWGDFPSTELNRDGLCPECR